jgi:hypothetical protein
MPLKTLRKIWLAIALICLIVCLDFYSVTQNWPLNFGTKLVVELKLSDLTPVAGAVHGLIFVPILLTLSAFLAWVHARRSTGASPAEKFPFRLADVLPNTVDGKWIQAVAAFFFVVVPLISILHFWDKIYGEKICYYLNDAIQEFDLSIWDKDMKGADLLDHSYRIGGTSATPENRLPKCNGITFEPFWEPRFFAFTTFMALFASAACVFETLIRRAKPKTA